MSMPPPHTPEPRRFTPMRPISTSGLRLEDLDQDSTAGGTPVYTTQKSSPLLLKHVGSPPLALNKVRPSDSGAIPQRHQMATDSALILVSDPPVSQGEERSMNTATEDMSKDRTPRHGSTPNTTPTPRQSLAGDGAGTFKANTFKLDRNSKIAVSMRMLIEGDDDEEDTPPKPVKNLKGIHKVKALDAFAYKEKPNTIIGGVVTVAIIVALVAYTVYIVLAYMNRPWTKTPVNQWTYISGPWPLRMRCRAASGCYVSNHVTRQWSSLNPDPTQSTCTYLKPGEWTTVQIYFSNNPNEGLGVIFIPGPSNTTLLPPTSMPQAPETLPSNFGLEIESIVVCPPGFTGCTDDTLSLLTPVGGGLNLLFLVETTNHSASGAGIFRREWYPTQIANLNNRPDVAVVPEATACDAVQFNNSWAHSRVRVNAEYVELSVNRDALWLVIWGAVGGALGMFMQIGGLLLGGTSLLLQLLSRPARGTESSITASVTGSTNERAMASVDPEAPQKQGRS